MCLAVGIEPLRPFGLQLDASLHAASEVLERVVGNVEALVGIPAVGFFGQPDLLLAER